MLQDKASQSLRARAYENFRQQTLQANVSPGQFVSQRELMQLLDMPLGAVRELIPRLEAEGLLRTVPQRGLQIAHVDLKLIHNAFELRGLLEREAERKQAVGHGGRHVGGGLGVREFARLARQLELPADKAAFVVELAYGAGLVEDLDAAPHVVRRVEGVGIGPHDDVARGCAARAGR